MKPLTGTVYKRKLLLTIIFIHNFSSFLRNMKISNIINNWKLDLVSRSNPLKYIIEKGSKFWPKVWPCRLKIVFFN